MEIPLPYEFTTVDELVASAKAEGIQSLVVDTTDEMNDLAARTFYSGDVEVIFRSATILHHLFPEVNFGACLHVALIWHFG